MKKIHYSGEPCYHAGAGIDLVPGDMEVTEEQAEQLAAILGHKPKDVVKSTEKKERTHGQV